MKNKSLFAFLLFALAALGCHEKKHRPMQLEKVHCRRVQKTVSDSSSDWLYWYWIQDSYSRNFYYFSSPMPVNEGFLSTETWSKAKALPEEIEREAGETLPDEDVSPENLSGVESDMENFFESIPENNSLDSMEGVPETEPASDPETDTSSGPSDSGAGDSE